LRGAVDDLTGWFLVERQLGRGGKCDMVVPVFDGYARYNMRFSDAGEQDLSPSRGQNFAGKARVCLMKREDISALPPMNRKVRPAPANCVRQVGAGRAGAGD